MILEEIIVAHLINVGEEQIYSRILRKVWISKAQHRKAGSTTS
jgi:hypothetical protein